LTPILNANEEEDKKILILTDYLIKHESKTQQEARSIAIATIYGKPRFKDLVYYDSSEMFFGTIVSQKGDFSRDVSFYMPKKRAYEFMHQLHDGLIEIQHAFDKEEKIVFKNIQLQYKDVNYPIRIIDKNSINIKLGTYFTTNIETELTTSKNGVGGIINFQDLFDMEKQNTLFRVDADYAFNKKHKIEFSYYNLKTSNSESVEKSFTYNGELIDAGAYINAYFNTEIYKLNYIYSPYKTNKLDLLFRIGLHTTKITSGVSGLFKTNENDETIQSESIGITAPLPTLGLGLTYNIFNNIQAKFVIDYFVLSFDETSGSMIDSVFSVDYKYNRYIGFGLGINTNNIVVIGKSKDIDIDVRHEVAGVLGYLIFSY
jgi:hypothetical protein